MRLAMKTPKKFVVMNIKIDPKVKATLAKAAARDGQTSSAVVRKLVADYLREQGFLK
jgi:predicted transcriptional regulator